MNISQRAKNLLTEPNIEWLRINSEPGDLKQLIITYLIPLSLIGVVANFIGWGFIGVSSYVRVASISWGLVNAIIYVLRIVVGAIITTYIIDALAPTFKSQKNIHKSAQLVIYSYTPTLLGAVFNIFPAIGIIGVLCGLYGLYLIFAGLHILKRTPDDQRIGYIVATILVLIAVYIIIGVIIASSVRAIWGFDLYNGY